MGLASGLKLGLGLGFKELPGPTTNRALLLADTMGSASAKLLSRMVTSPPSRFTTPEMLESEISSSPLFLLVITGETSLRSSLSSITSVPPLLLMRPLSACSARPARSCLRTALAERLSPTPPSLSLPPGGTSAKGVSESTSIMGLSPPCPAMGLTTILMSLLPTSSFVACPAPPTA